MSVSHYALPSASRPGLCDPSCWGDFRPAASHPIAIEQLQGVVQPLPTPSFPAEALPLLSLRHMAPDLLLHPIFDEAEALAGVPHREVVHPPPHARPVGDRHQGRHWRNGIGPIEPTSDIAAWPRGP